MIYPKSGSGGVCVCDVWCVHPCVSGVYVCVCSLSPVQLFVTPWTVAHQAPLSMGVVPARILEWVAVSSSRGSS